MKHTNEDRIKQLEAALSFALKYMLKADEKGAYDNYVISGKTAINRLEKALKGTE